jgi:hypothetical protein
MACHQFDEKKTTHLVILLVPTAAHHTQLGHCLAPGNGITNGGLSLLSTSLGLVSVDVCRMWLQSTQR